MEVQLGDYPIAWNAVTDQGGVPEIIVCDESTVSTKSVAAEDDRLWCAYGPAFDQEVFAGDRHEPEVHVFRCRAGEMTPNEIGLFSAQRAKIVNACVRHTYPFMSNNTPGR